MLRFSFLKSKFQLYKYLLLRIRKLAKNLCSCSLRVLPTSLFLISLFSRWNRVSMRWCVFRRMNEFYRQPLEYLFGHALRTRQHLLVRVLASGFVLNESFQNRVLALVLPRQALDRLADLLEPVQVGLRSKPTVNSLKSFLTWK